MISIISINNSTTDPVISNQNIPENIADKEEEQQNNYNKTTQQFSTTVPGLGLHSIVHENVHAQLVHSDEYDVDEGFNEDSSSSITSGNTSIVSALSSSLTITSSPTFSTNFKDNSPQTLITISGPNGSVRGKRNSVRSRVQNYKELIKLANTSKADLQRNYEKEEQNLCVLYITSMGIIRKTYESCRQLKAILIQHLIRFDERDIYINPNFKTELIERTGSSLELPMLFVNGKRFGSLDVVERLNECGQFSNLLSNFKLQANAMKVCDCCGGTKFIPCQTCNGSMKSQIHHFVSDSISLKCSQCRRSGLQKCPKCYTNTCNDSEVKPN